VRYLIDFRQAGKSKKTGGMVHRAVAIFLALAAAAIICNPGPAMGQERQEAVEEIPGVSSSAAVLMDRESKRVLYGKNQDLRRPMASITKIMTAVLALEKGDLQSQVTVSEKAASTGGSSVNLEKGEEKTLEELLYGLMLRSGNDAAVAIAEHLGGSIEEFAMMMTRKARDIGAKNTSFKNPHGLHHVEHYTTALDMALITSYAMENKIFYRISSSPWAVISWPDREWDRILRNQNRLLHMYEGADGVKTGWTSPAGRCFVGSATRDERQLIVVVLNAPEMYEDAQRLLDYGFQYYSREKLIEKGRVLKSVKLEQAVDDYGNVIAAENFYYPLKEEEKEKVRYLFRLKEPQAAPINAGEVIGKLEMRLHGEAIGTIDLTVAEDIERSPFYYFIIKLWESFFS